MLTRQERIEHTECHAAQQPELAIRKTIFVFDRRHGDGKDSAVGSVQHRGREQQHQHIDAPASAVRLRGAVALRDLRL